MLFMDTPSQKWQNGENRINKMCFIGRNLDKQMLEDGVKSCLVTGELRFKIGDKVKCYMGENTWEEGVVTKHWDEGNAYRVKLNNAEKIQAPVDEDFVIKKAD